MAPAGDAGGGAGALCPDGVAAGAELCDEYAYHAPADAAAAEVTVAAATMIVRTVMTRKPYRSAESNDTCVDR
jgi:hypothetical protein